MPYNGHCTFCYCIIGLLLTSRLVGVTASAFGATLSATFETATLYYLHETKCKLHCVSSTQLWNDISQMFCTDKNYAYVQQIHIYLCVFNPTAIGNTLKHVIGSVCVLTWEMISNANITSISHTDIFSNLDIIWVQIWNIKWLRFEWLNNICQKISDNWLTRTNYHGIISFWGKIIFVVLFGYEAIVIFPLTGIQITASKFILKLTFPIIAYRSQGPFC